MVVSSLSLDGSRGASDKKSYRLIVLENGLEALLINEPAEEGAEEGEEWEDESDDDDDEDDDEESDNDDGSSGSDDSDGSGKKRSGGPTRAAASMAVGVGSWADPADAQGCAHFLEHMLFMGSKKFEDENHYDAFISKHGGSTNAHTDVESTHYYFEVLPGAFAEALDVFAQFFIDPLMRPDAVEREVQAIESEFRETIRQDCSRLDELMARSAPDGHPFGTFSWGNTESLRGGDAAAVAALHAMHDDHYHASNMKLCVVSTASLDDLEGLVSRTFAAVRKSGPVPAPTGDLAWRRTTWDAPPVPLPPPLAASLGTLTRVRPVCETHELRLVWPLPSLAEHWRSRPSGLAAHVLGHEGSQSALALLRRRGWATDLCAGIAEEDGCATSLACGYLFAISVTLTDRGVGAWASVVDVIMSATRVASAGLFGPGGSYQRVLDEAAAIADLRFDYASESDASDTAEWFASALLPMRGFPREHLLRANSDCILGRDEATAKAMFDTLGDAKKARFELLSSNFLDKTAAAADAADDATVEVCLDAEVCGKVCGCAGRRGFHAALSALAKAKPAQTAPAAADDSGRAASEAAFSEPSALGRAAPGRAALVEPRFGTEYWLDALDAAVLESWGRGTDATGAGLALPPPNAFIAQSFELTPPVEPRVSGSADDDAAKAACAKVDSDLVAMWLPKKKPGKKTIVTAKAQFEKDTKEDFPRPRELDPAPVLVVDGVGTRVWHAGRCARFGPLPKASITFRVASPALFRGDAARLVLADVAASVIEDALVDDLYAATCACLSYSASVSEGAIIVRCSGFSEPLPRLLEAVCGKVRQAGGDAYWANATRLDSLRETRRRDYGNAWVSDVARHAKSLRLCVLLPETNVPPEQKAAAMDSVLGAAELRSRMRAALEAAEIDVLVSGNLDDAAACATAHAVRRLRAGEDVAAAPDGAPAAMAPAMVRMLPPGSTAVVTQRSRDAEDPTSALEVYWQLGADSLGERVLTELVEAAIEEPIYSQLRTKEQLGYSVSCGARWTGGVLGFGVRIVSDKAHPDYLEQRLDAFLKDFRTTMMKPDFVHEFAELAASSAENKLERERSVGELADRHWQCIADDRTDFFDAPAQEALAIAHSTPAGLRAMYDALFGFGPLPRKAAKLVIRVVGQGANFHDGKGPDDDTPADSVVFSDPPSTVSVNNDTELLRAFERYGLFIPK
ncbi:Metalloenzyme, LuxS/M16 peptidase-like protein [Pelagophyceae sp. CCMP2097]|nr:Metalloenzyme, LuxS/M16 peptidase-like protein [Pelagophyceae sp. CCMP2097]